MQLTTPLIDALSMMLERQVSALPVVDDDGILEEIFIDFDLIVRTEISLLVYISIYIYIYICIYIYIYIYDAIFTIAESRSRRVVQEPAHHSRRRSQTSQICEW